MDNIVGRLQSIFSSHQIDVIIGSLLGDARLECRSIGVRSPITARLRVHHGAKQKEYVLWKHKILKNIVSREPQEISWDNSRRNLHEVSWYFHTKSLEVLGFLYHYFYKNKIKILPRNIFDVLNEQMLAVWFMDDGSHNGKNLTLNTHSFSKDDQERIQTFLREKLGVKSTVVKDRHQWKISIGVHDYENFISIIKPFVIPAMNYKIVYPRNDLSA
ncbi:MAG: LAGLIDADG endonuclease [bacterium]|nr:LAGLIDADG endonuclease [bacterium]